MNKSESKYFNTAVKFDKALLSLLDQKPFAYITISEICEAAGVYRSTFYLHYENIGELLKETMGYVLDRFSSYFPVDREKFIAKFSRCSLQELQFINEEYLHPYLQFIKENQRLFSAVLSQPAAFDTNAVFQRMFDNIFAPILSRFHYPQDEQNYVMMFYLSGITAIIGQWLKDGCKKSVEEVASIIRCCVYGREGFPCVSDSKKTPQDL